MRKSFRLIAGIVAVALVLLAAANYLHGHNVAVLSPRGTIGARERSLMIYATLLMLIVVVPVYLMTFGIAWKYREGNQKARYEPDWDGSRKMEITWWAIPGIIITILAFVTWHSSHALDPFKPLTSKNPPITVQVVALDWKWLFIYPQQRVASVNFVEFPVDTPVSFNITSDAPMNSFWIPQLGGQIYAMSGMSTSLSLEADKPGDYAGVSANISGRGFADMKFTARASSQADYEAWLKQVKKSSTRLGLDEYNKLAQPSVNNPVSYYGSTQAGLYNLLLTKFMEPQAAGGTY